MLLDYDEVGGCVPQTLYITLVIALSYHPDNIRH